MLDANEPIHIIDDGMYFLIDDSAQINIGTHLKIVHFVNNIPNISFEYPAILAGYNTVN